MALVSFGPVVIAAHATPVNAADYLFPDRAPGTPVPLRSVTFQADESNSGPIYGFFTSDGTDHSGDKDGLAFILTAPYFPDAGDVPAPLDRITYGFDADQGGIDLQNVWFQSQVDGDSVIVSGTR